MADAAGEFCFPGTIWFIGPKPPYFSLDELCGVLLQGLFEETTSGKLVPIVYAFSDRDLAERFLKRSGPEAAAYVPVELSDDGQLIDLLKELQFRGHRFLGADTEHTSACVLPISAVIDQVQRRKDPPPDSLPSG